MGGSGAFSMWPTASIIELLAKKIIEIGQTDMRGPVQIGRLALKEIGITNPRRVSVVGTRCIR
jgi:hypothetical protein